MPIDPLNLTQVITTLITTTGKAAIGIKSWVDKYQGAPRILSSIRIETITIEAALSHLYWIINRDRDVLRTHLSYESPLLETIDIAINGIVDTYGQLELELKKLGNVENKTGDYDWNDKLRYIWNEDTMKILLDQMRSLVNAINLVLNALQMDTITALVELLTAKRPTIEKVRLSLASVRAVDPSSLDLDSKSTAGSRSIFSEAPSRNFEFDKELQETEVYKRARNALVHQSAILRLDEPGPMFGASYTGNEIAPQAAPVDMGYDAPDTLRGTTVQPLSPTGQDEVPTSAPSLNAQPGSSDRIANQQIEDETPTGRSTSIELESYMRVGWTHEPKWTFSFVRTIGVPLWTRPLEVRLLILDGRQIHNNLTIMRRIFGPGEPPDQVVAGFHRFEIEGEATVNETVHAVIGTIWDIQTRIMPLHKMDREHKQACTNRDLVLLCFTIPSSGIIEGMMEKRIEVQQYCPYSPVMIVGIWPGKSSSRRASEESTASYSGRLSVAKAAGAICYIETMIGQQNWRENLISVFIGYAAAFRFDTKPASDTDVLSKRRRSIPYRSRSRDEGRKGFRDFFI